MFELKVINQFRDIPATQAAGHDVIRHSGDIITVDDVERTKILLGYGPHKIKFCELLSAKKRATSERKGKKIIFYNTLLFYIGGIETFSYNLAKEYYDRDITIIAGEIDPIKAIQLSEYCDIIVDKPGMKYECDVLVLGNYNADIIIPRVKADKIYQMIHADWKGLKESVPQWQSYQWQPKKEVEKLICVSQTAQKGLKEAFGLDSEVIYNILDNDPTDGDMRVFITLSRATAEKGIDRIIKMAQKFKEAGKHFIWYICCSLEQTSPDIRRIIESIPEFIIIPPSYYNQSLIKNCDYLVQLSGTESFCYSAFEALQRNVPVILTEFPEAYNIIDDGENGYILKYDLSNLDVDKIFNEVPKNLYYIDRCNKDDWEAVFKGEY